MKEIRYHYLGHAFGGGALGQVSYGGVQALGSEPLSYFCLSNYIHMIMWNYLPHFALFDITVYLVDIWSTNELTFGGLASILVDWRNVQLPKRFNHDFKR